MEWQLDRRRNVQTRQVTSSTWEVTGKFTSPSESMGSSLPALQPLIDLFKTQGENDWAHAPECLRLTVGKMHKILPEVLDWAVSEGIVVAIERDKKRIAYRLSEKWQDWLLGYATAKSQPSETDWVQIERVYSRYGKLGLRTASQIAFGDSHFLDEIEIPMTYKDKVWAIPDVVSRGANIVRAGGKISFRTPYASFSERWSIPGHFFWSWDITNMISESFCTANRILLIENPYAFWHLLGRMQGQEVAMICLHGETRHNNLLTEDADLYQLLKAVITQSNQPQIFIWCDPDPGGLVMATNAMEIITKLGGKASFLMMGEEALTCIEELSMCVQPLRSLTENDQAILQAERFHSDLSPLANEMKRRNCKGEQECLAIHLCSMLSSLY